MLELDQEGIKKQLQEHDQRVREKKEDELLTQAEADTLPARNVLSRAWSRIKEIFGAGDSIQDTLRAYEDRKQQVEKIKQARGIAAEVSQETQGEITAAGELAKGMSLDTSAEIDELAAEEKAAKAELDRETDELTDAWCAEGDKASAEVEMGRSPSSNLEDSEIARATWERETIPTTDEKQEPTLEWEPTPAAEASTTVEDIDMEDEGIEEETATDEETTGDEEITQVFTNKTAEADESKPKLESEKVNSMIEQILNRTKQISARINGLTDNQNLKDKLNSLSERLENNALMIVYKQQGFEKLETDEPIMLDLLAELDNELSDIEQQATKQEAETAKIEAQINKILQHMPEQVRSRVATPDEQKKLADEARQLLHEWNRIDTAKSGGFVDHFSNPRQLEQASLQALKIREQEQAIRQDNADALANLSDEESAAIVAEARKRIFSWDEADKDKPGFTSHFENPYQRKEAVRQVMAEKKVEEKIEEKKEIKPEKSTVKQTETDEKDEERQMEDDADLPALADTAPTTEQPAAKKRTTATSTSRDSQITEKTKFESAEELVGPDDETASLSIGDHIRDLEKIKNTTKELDVIEKDLSTAEQTAQQLRNQAKGFGGRIERLADDYWLGLGMLKVRCEAIANSHDSPKDKAEALTALKADVEKKKIQLMKLELEIKIEQLKNTAKKLGNQDLFDKASDVASDLNNIGSVLEENAGSEGTATEAKIFFKNITDRINKLKTQTNEETKQNGMAVAA